MPNLAEAQDLYFNARYTKQCLLNAVSSDEKLDCIGVSAENCTSQADGETTYGMGFCLERELQYWDTRLNEVYRKVQSLMRISDESLPIDLAVQSSTLRDMQRAWITYRDRRCEHEASLWQGGTGSGPAFLSCMMSLTAEQMLYLSELESNQN